MYTIYVDEITAPPLTTILADTFAVNKKGYFTGRLKKKYSDGTIFKITLYHNGQPVNPLDDAVLSNSILLTNSGKTGITITAAADTLFFDAAIETTSAACRQLMRLEAYKKTLYRAMQQATAGNNKGPSQLAYAAFISAVEHYREQMLQQFRLQTIPAASLLCLYNLSLTQAATINQPDTALLYPYIRTKKFPNTQLAEKLLFPYRNHISTLRLQTGQIKVTALNGIQKQLAEMTTGDSIAVIYCWASWCGPCRKANKTYLPGFAAALEVKGIFFGSVSIDTDMNSWKKAVADDKIKWPQYIDGANRKLYRQLSVNAVPYYAVINKKGDVVFETHTWLQLNEYINAYYEKK